MRIVCNRPGGFGIIKLHVTAGENLIDDALWSEVAARLDPKWLAALTMPTDTGPAQLELYNDAGEPMPPYAPAPARVADLELSAKEKIALVEAATTYDQLDALELNETRKTVIAAIYKRAERLDNGEASE
jgi:hypothetical protein